MRTKVIDEVLPPAAGGPDPPGRDRAAAAAATNNNTNTNTADPPVVGATIPGDPPGVVGGIMLPRTSFIKQETSLAAAEIAAFTITLAALRPQT